MRSRDASCDRAAAGDNRSRRWPPDGDSPPARPARPARPSGRPAVYTAFRTALSRTDTASVFVRDYIRARPGDKVLDIGCGPCVILRDLPDVRYTGVEPDARYVAEARRQYGGRARFILGTGRTVALDDAGSYDIALAIGVLHHLNEGDAGDLLRFARLAIRPGGRLVTLDCGFTADQSLVSRFIVGLDRGRHIRAPEQYVRLIDDVFSGCSVVVRHDLLRLLYTHDICEATA